MFTGRFLPEPRTLANVNGAPIGVKLAAGACLLTAWLPAGFGVWEIVQIISTVPDPEAVHFGVPVFFLVAAILLSLVIRPLLAGRAWARSVVLTWLLVFAFSVTTLIKSMGPFGWVGVVIAAAGVVSLALPASWSYFGTRTFPAED